MSKLKLYNTLTRKKETFEPIVQGKVGMYSCGPTVYWYQHIGNLRTYIFSDLLRRVLEFNGFKVKHVINVTDVGHLTSDSDEGEDKVEEAAKREKKKAKEITKFYFHIFKEDLKKLNIELPWKWPKASEHIKEQIGLVKKLEKKGFTYRTRDGIYFDSSRFKNYWKMAKLDLKGLKAGKRVEVGDKKHKTDFALWKFSLEDGKRQQEWKSPWGVGFPGWHIECSAMSMKYLGKHFDIHTGGEDHIPVHHTNEIAQSESATGKRFVNYWLHGAFLLSKGEKISKSSGGLYTISEIEKMGYDAVVFRYLCLLTHYRKPLNFSLDNLDAAKNSFQNFRRKVIEIRNEKHKGNDLTESYTNLFLIEINDDLNLPRALRVVLKMLDDFDFSSGKKIKLLEKFDEVLGLKIKEMKEEKIIIPKEVLELAEERESLRRQKLWAKADLFRERIREKGFSIEDTNDGYKISNLD
ncbi:cysteine--tRNA ligase [Candidatus Pacearchaeota archaeon]|nr:cysteine--tRNA ligase [Candidatus Pacearchaeota archaeon]